MHLRQKLRRAACCGAIAAGGLVLCEPGAVAQTTPAARGDVVTITGSPLGGERDLASLPHAAVRITADDLARSGPADLLNTLEGRIGGVMLTNAQGNGLQPELVYRGFGASPLQGAAQGLAVYLDGARFNQAFGDTVEWDLAPAIAIDTIDLVGASPAFGLNALGGALNVGLKNSLNASGGSAEFSGGSFGRKAVTAEASQRWGAFGVYGAINAMDEDGWRDHSPSSVRQAYFDFGWSGERADYRLSLMGARTDLTGNGAAPVELLAADRESVFTYPDRSQSDFGRVQLAADWRLDGGWLAKARLTAGRLDRKTRNGDAAEVEVCEDDAAELCGEDGDTELTDINGDDVPNFITGSAYEAEFPEFGEGGPYAFLNRTSTGTSNLGLSASLEGDRVAFGVSHHLVVGGEVDAAVTHFAASSELGALTADRGWAGPGVIIDAPQAGVVPVRVRVRTTHGGAYISDAVKLTPQLTLTVAARANLSRIILRDGIGTELNGDHTFRRINPSAGLAYRASDALTVYGGYAETSRTPTPAELSCADPAAPCSLANFFVADPPLSQVVAHTWEAGVRGASSFAGADLDWRAGVFRADVEDDIQMVASGVAGRGYFTNVGKTRREGLEAGVQLVRDGFTAFAEYAWTRTTYRTSFDLNPGANPQFDEDDLMTVEPGDRRPGVPEHVLKAGADVVLPAGWTAGMDAIWSSGRYFFGDEANVNARTDSYVVVNAHARVAIGKSLEAFAQVQNLFNKRYETFGAFAPVDEVPIIGLGELGDPRALTPAPPRALIVGLRVSF